MHEVLTLSVSHRSNHLATQFYNCQEELLSGNHGKLNHASTFLNPVVDKVSKTVSYSPRCLLWDARGGSGSMAKFQYHSEEDYFDFDSKEHSIDLKADKMFTSPRVMKSEYQKALDRGLPMNQLPALNAGNTKYWTDYSKLIYNPNDLTSLQDWYYDEENPNLPDFQQLKERKFGSFSVGYEKFNESCRTEFVDEQLHRQLEQCDTLQGINIISDLDNGWGGFSSALMQELRLELPKISIFTWGSNVDDALSLQQKGKLNLNKTSLSQILTKIRSTVSLTRESDLFFPIYVDSHLSNWEFAGQACRIMDTVNSVFSQSTESQRKKMDYLTNCISQGDSLRNIVSQILLDDSAEDYAFYHRIRNFDPKFDKQYHVFSSCKIVRGDLDPNAKYLDKYIVQTYPYTPSDTIPTVYKPKRNFSLQLSSTEATRNVYKFWLNIVTKYLHYDDDREELKEFLGSMAAAHEHGWYDDDDSGDDDM